MKLQVQADRYQYLLMEGARVVGHYSDVLSLLKGAREAIRKDRTKGAVDLRALIENGIAHEGRTLEQIEGLAKLSAALKGKL